MPSKKPATLIAIPEERSMSSVSSDSSGISKGMTMALDKFASVFIFGGQEARVDDGLSRCRHRADSV